MKGGKDMRKFWINIIVFLLGILMFSCGWAAGLETGNDLLEDCNNAILSFDNNGEKGDLDKTLVCVSYVRGIVDSNASFSALLGEAYKKNFAALCIPSKTNFTQMIRIIVKYLKDNPKSLNQHPIVDAQMALHYAFPCKKDAA
jgi:hypothetical protein